MFLYQPRYFIQDDYMNTAAAYRVKRSFLKEKKKKKLKLKNVIAIYYESTWKNAFKWIFMYKFEFLLTLIYPPHFEDVRCQSGGNHIYKGSNNCVSRQVIYHCK